VITVGGGGGGWWVQHQQAASAGSRQHQQAAGSTVVVCGQRCSPHELKPPSSALSLNTPPLRPLHPQGTFDLLVYTDNQSAVPDEWEESDPRYITNATDVKLRSFTTKVGCVLWWGWWGCYCSCGLVERCVGLLFQSVTVLQMNLQSPVCVSNLHPPPKHTRANPSPPNPPTPPPNPLTQVHKVDTVVSYRLADA